jgi:hypothetical protein
MTAPDTELTAQVAAAVRAEREAKLADLGHDAVLWLALVPLWTKSAAEAAGFPAPSVTDFVRRARGAGWCETRGSLRDGGSPNLRFWMPDTLRRDVLDLMRRHMAGAAQEIAARLARQDPYSQRLTDPYRQAVLPGALQAWAELVPGPSWERALIDAVRRAVDAEDLGRGQEYVAAGETLAALREGTMELAVDRARRMLALGKRRRMDARDLERYLDRRELSFAVDDLLEGGTGQWALHLRGVGGVGKTMLIRYLASGRYAADRYTDPIPVARADFDHMNPEYPVRRPVQLLLELADELTLHTAAVSRADRALLRFRGTAVSVHEALSGARAERQSVMRDPLVLAAIDDFAGALRQLPRALLILDTCEELAKADTRDLAAPAVQTTLAILERIHDLAPNVRVLFAGRRSLPPRAYLAVQNVGGFTHVEARRYLDMCPGPPLPADLTAEMIRQSPAVDDPERVSPFDLALYRSWADEDPDLTAEQVARGSDAYIEGRIIERLHDRDVLCALPALAVAGRCRVTTLATFLDADPAHLGRRLAEQEWIDAAGDPPEHVEAKPALAKRLVRYFHAPEREPAFTAEATRLAAALRTALRDVPFDDVDVDELLAALRLSDPADAAFWLWDALADRARNERRWNWLLNVSRRVLGESVEQDWPTAAALRATVLAASIAACRRAAPTFDTLLSWSEVFSASENHPDPRSGDALRTRAALGLLPYPPRHQEFALRVALEADFTDPELSAAAADAAHRLLESGHVETAASVLAAGWPPPDSRRGPWFWLLDARLKADSDPHAAAESLAAAERGAIAARPGPERWDWIEPDDLLARVWIEWALIAPPDSGTLAEWESYAAGHFDTIDAERLASQCLTIRLGRGVIEPSAIERWERTDRYEPGWAATCSAHDLVPPLFVTIAEAWLAAGEPGRALDLLDRRRREALATREDEATIRHADAATVRITRRLRLEDQRALLMRLSRTSNRDQSWLPLRDDAHRARAVVFGEQPGLSDGTPDSRPAGFHSRWQCQAGEPLASPVSDWPSDAASTDLAADIELDLEELRRLDSKGRLAADRAARLAGWLARPRPAMRARSADPHRDVRVVMRRAALDDRPYQPPPEMPRRLFAEMAFNEAELLQLRLPDPAARLFGYARDAYADSGDRIGEVLAAASRAAVTGKAPHRAQLNAALEALRRASPSLTDLLAGDPNQAGPWRYWAVFLRGLQEPTAVSLETTRESRTRARIRTWTQDIASVALIGGGAAAAAFMAYQAAPRTFATGVLALLALLAVSVVATDAWRVPSLLRLADGRGIGSGFRPADMECTTIVYRGRRARVELSAHLKPLRAAHKSTWPRLVIMGLAIMLTAPLRWGRVESGFTGDVTEEGALNWGPGESPDADGLWWSRGTAAGVILTDPATAGLPWEEILATSFGPWGAAVGRVMWHRQLSVNVRLPEAHTARDVKIAAPERWRHLERVLNSEADHIWARHAVGRVVSTSAGTRLDIGGEASDQPDLIDSAELGRGAPTVIILQAEPVADLDDLDVADDMTEKRALAMDLIEAGAAPAVLIVPAIPVGKAEDAAAVIYRHGIGRHDARDLQARLWRLLSPILSPGALQNLVLFVNVGGRRE